MAQSTIKCSKLIYDIHKKDIEKIVNCGNCSLTYNQLTQKITCSIEDTSLYSTRDFDRTVTKLSYKILTWSSDI